MLGTIYTLALRLAFTTCVFCDISSKRLESPSLEFDELARIIAEEWASLSEEAKTPYKDKADEDSVRYEAMGAALVLTQVSTAAAFHTYSNTGKFEYPIVLWHGLLPRNHPTSIVVASLAVGVGFSLEVTMFCVEALQTSTYRYSRIFVVLTPFLWILVIRY